MSQNYTLAQIVNGRAGFAKRVGIPQKVAKEFHAADKRKEK